MAGEEAAAAGGGGGGKNQIMTNSGSLKDKLSPQHQKRHSRASKD